MTELDNYARFLYWERVAGYIALGVLVVVCLLVALWGVRHDRKLRAEVEADRRRRGL